MLMSEVIKIGEMEENLPEYGVLLAVFCVLQVRIELEMEGDNSVLRVALYCDQQSTLTGSSIICSFQG